jgi:hypothetical protein
MNLSIPCISPGPSKRMNLCQALTSAMDIAMEKDSSAGLIGLFHFFHLIILFSTENVIIITNGNSALSAHVRAPPAALALHEAMIIGRLTKTMLIVERLYKVVNSRCPRSSQHWAHLHAYK